MQAAIDPKKRGKSNQYECVFSDLVKIFVEIIEVDRSGELVRVPTVMSLQPLAEFDQHLWVDS
jgi:hypothetical protein